MTTTATTLNSEASDLLTAPNEQGTLQAEGPTFEVCEFIRTELGLS